jgi:hypothetical protein
MRPSVIFDVPQSAIAMPIHRDDGELRHAEIPGHPQDAFLTSDLNWFLENIQRSCTLST